MEKCCYRCGDYFNGKELSRICDKCRVPPNTVRKMNKELTRRELQVVGLVSRGFGNKQIAYELRLSPGTIKEYMNRIFHKLKVDNRTQLAVWYIRKKAAEAVVTTTTTTIKDGEQ